MSLSLSHPRTNQKSKGISHSKESLNTGTVSLCQSIEGRNMVLATREINKKCLKIKKTNKKLSKTKMCWYVSLEILGNLSKGSCTHLQAPSHWPQKKDWGREWTRESPCWWCRQQGSSGQGHYREFGEGGRKQGGSLIHFPETSFIRSKSLGWALNS